MNIYKKNDILNGINKDEYDDISTMSIWGYASTDDIQEHDEFIVMKTLDSFDKNYITENLVNIEDTDSAAAEIDIQITNSDTHYLFFSPTLGDQFKGEELKKQVKLKYPGADLFLLGLED